MYKDIDKQREVVREATRRYRLKKGITTVSQEKVSPKKIESVIPKAIKLVEDIPKLTIPSRPSHHPTCRCLMCGGK